LPEVRPVLRVRQRHAKKLDAVRIHGPFVHLVLYSPRSPRGDASGRERARAGHAILVPHTNGEIRQFQRRPILDHYEDVAVSRNSCFSKLELWESLHDLLFSGTEWWNGLEDFSPLFLAVKSLAGCEAASEPLLKRRGCLPPLAVKASENRGVVKERTI